MLFRSFLSDCWILQTTTAAPVGASIDRSAVSRLNNDGAHMAGGRTPRCHHTAFGEINADSVAHARHRNGVRRSVLCDTVNNNNNNNKLKLGCHLVAVVILHVHKYDKK